MRKPFALLVAAMLIAVTAWWTVENFAVSVVPGWHTPILAPWTVLALVAIAVLLGIAFVILFKVLGGGNNSR